MDFEKEERTKLPEPATMLVLFVRAPVSGRVKTRLARHLGHDAACDLYRAMVDDLLAGAKVTGYPIALFHDGDAAAELPVDWRRCAMQVIPQQGETLGARMAAAFSRGFADGWEKILLAGSDIPGLDADIIHSATVALDDHDVAIVPAKDGGYCLIALKRKAYRPDLFHCIPWSTDRVLELTLERCRQASLSVATLQALQDLDTLDDLERYCRQPCETAPSINAHLEKLGFKLSRTVSVRQRLSIGKDLCHE